MSRHSRRMPSEVSPQQSFFDRFAGAVGAWTARAWFFAACCLAVLVWAPTILVIQNVDTWQLIINTATTIVTFLMVAIVQNTQARADLAAQQKLNAVAMALATLLEELGDQPEATRELRAAVGVEERESSP